MSTPRSRMPHTLAVLAVVAVTLGWPARAHTYDPVAGGEVLTQLASPLFLATGESTLSTDSISGDIYNPAISAQRQRIHLDASYAAIVGSGQWDGHAANAGLAVPTPIGVFVGSVNYVQAQYNALNAGNRFSINTSFSKELYPRLLFGAGVRGHLGTVNGAFGAGGGLDLGVIHTPGMITALPDLRIGVALQQLGIGFRPATGTTGSPSPFTLSADIGATIVDSEAIDIALQTGLSFPSFQNVRYRAAGTLTAFDRVALSVGWDVDVREQLGGTATAGSLLPSVGLTVTFQTDIASNEGVIGEQGWNRSDIEIHSAWTPLYDSVWAAGGGIQAALGVVDRTAPRIAVTYPATQYVSPNNDGQADELQIPVTIEDERYVVSWTLRIEDESGAPVRTIENKEQRPENEGFRNVIDRLLYRQRGIDIPATIRWDGRTDDGGTVADGTYRFVVTAVDDNGNVRETDATALVIDATPPAIAINVPENQDDLIFSPNADGNKDEIAFETEGSVEDRWLVEVTDVDDAVVYSETITESAVGTVTWDGTDGTGTNVPDGVYAIRIQATDRALNAGEAIVSNIIVDTEPTPIGVSVDRGHFSPNGDGRGDTVTLTPDIPVAEGVRDWQYRVVDASGSMVRRHVGTDRAPDAWAFDGRADNGQVLPEGLYRVDLQVRYRNGNAPETTSPPIELDVTPPRLAVRADRDVLSPNGDGRFDTVRFLHDTESLPLWRGEIINARGETARSWEWPGSPEAELTWNGRSDDGDSLPDGEYTYVVSAEDRAGNVNRSTPLNVEIDTRETPVFVATGREAFSPNGDGRADRISVIPEVADPRGAQSFAVEITNEANEVVARISDAGAPSNAYEWDGRTTAGTIAPDGTYRLGLEVQYRHGNLARAESPRFEIDTVAPRATVRTDTAIFSPDGDGAQDELIIEQQSSAEELWVAEILSLPAGSVVRSWEFSGELERLAWDGTNDEGRVVPDGAYRYRVRATDRAGNSFSTETERLAVDTRAVDATTRFALDAFSPNGDAIRDTVDIESEITVDTPIEAWTLAIIDASGNAVYQEDGAANLRTVTWDGRGPAGRLPDGTYRARLSVAFSRGDELVVTSARPVILDTVAPSASVELSSEIISPNGDGNLDQLRITQRTSSEDRWVATITDDGAREVGRWEWVGMPPAELTFSGLTTGRQRVRDGLYRYQLAATDRAGNATTVGPFTFEVYTAETPLELFAREIAFSPNGDGQQDSVRIDVTRGDAEGLERYRFTIQSASGEAVRTETGTSVPAQFVWDGTDNSGRRVAEGSYRAELALFYRHGNAPVATTRPVELDITAPAITLDVADPIVSPDGDGRKDTLLIALASDPAEEWRGEIVNGAGEPMRTLGWPSQLASLDWDGRDDAGNTVPDGQYAFRVRGRDDAGNAAEARFDGLTVDTRSARLFVTTDRRIVSPNADGQDDIASIGIIASRTDGALTRRVEIVAADGTVVREFIRDGAEERETILWDGRTDDGAVLEGRYRARYTISFVNGAEPVALSPEITVDTQGPELAVQLDGLPFSPDNDGLNDELGISLTARDATAITTWSFEILDRNGRPFQRFDGTGTPTPRLLWDGRSDSGETVISAEDYPYRFTAIDSTGNRSEISGVIPIDILVVRDGDRLRIQISSINFQPNSPELNLDGSTEEGRKNLAVLDRLVEVFDKYASYQIRVEGHAVNLTGTDREEREELAPLSTARADRVRNALIERGMDPARISTLGRGGTDPVVPHTDLDNRWKNRRVEFILIR